MIPSNEPQQPELAISDLVCLHVDGAVNFSMTFTNMLDEHVAVYEVQVYVSLPEGDAGPEQAENVGVELGVGDTYDGIFPAYKPTGLPDENTYYIDVIYDDEQGDTFVEQYSTDTTIDEENSLIATSPKFIERYNL